MIPIRNLYYLLLYAWDALDEAEMLTVTSEPETKLLDLLAGVLNRGTDHLLRRGLDRNYLPRREAIPGIRGKFDVSATVKGNLLPRARAACEFDELSHDVLHNRILKATLRRLLQARSLNNELRAPIRATFHRLHEIADIHLTDRDFNPVQLHRNNRFYRFLLDVCRLLHDCLIPHEATGKLLFRSFLRDKHRMRRLFEDFVRNFFRREQKVFAVTSQRLHWENTSGSEADMGLLPGMVTDVNLTRPGQTIVIDAKYYRETLQCYRGRETVRSAHLYQLFAYLKNIAAKTGNDTEVEGMLLYPLTTRSLALTYQMHGHRVRVNTLNLNQDWQAIHHDLLGMLPKEY